MSPKKILFPLLLVMGVVAALGMAWWIQRPGQTGAGGSATTGPSAAAPGATARAPVVEVARVEVMKLSDETQAVGTLRSRQGVMLRPEVSGRVAQLNFRDGERVKKGQLLLQLDDQLPQAQIKQSQAELSIALANHQRNQELVAQKFISQRSVDESAAALEVAQAKLALTQVSAARLKLVAPFDGIVGIRNVSVGDYLKDGTDVVNIEDMDAVYVDFRLPERLQGKIKKGQIAMLDLDAVPGRRFSAVVQAIDPQIDASGRSVSVRGCVDNRQLQLRPGMFARVNAVFGERDKARVIPEEALVPQGNRQFVIKLTPGADKDTMVAQRVDVKLGIRKPGRVEILEGLEEGDLVVIAGQQRVQKDGTAVRVAEFGKAPTGNAGAPGAAPAAKADKPSAAIAQARADAGPNPCLSGS
ncbi:efflux RND transporter periplasmic adaptor subunit [Rhodoferax sp.]|uniref:efflux RND transporter periplasmic adaptor subunit n=1 Tax=Rhodoferax sp. TaxID=50421 RepID=UPI00275790C9|nr:efflux RND transporter periplasmic adaptor subunit [Rhodoferax sp.]